MTLELLALETVTILAESDSDSSAGIGLVFLLSGFVFYGAMYLRYRNSDKRHNHESETEAAMLDVRALDNHVKTLKGVSHSRMKGANNTAVRARQNGVPGGAIGQAVTGALGNLTGNGGPPGPPGKP